MWLRMPNMGVEEGILAVSLTPLGCGTESKIIFLTIIAPGG
jgi:hypothetical protein